METIQNYAHSDRKYETLSASTINTRIITIIEQQIKVKQSNGFCTIDAIGLILRETILHPQGGGQPSDVGFIDNIPVISVKEDKQIKSSSGNPVIYHFIDKKFLQENNTTINQNQEVMLTLNTDIRLNNSKTHSAGHLIADILEFHPKFSNLSAVATNGHHFPNEAYIKVLINADIEDREAFVQLLNECLVIEINSDLLVSSNYLDDVRHVEIGNSARKCGGTHVFSTKQIDSCIIKKIKVSKPSNDVIFPLELTIFYSC